MFSPDPPILKTLYLDHCWVCFVLRKKVSSDLEEHHIVPRCYGGEKGPTVSLCSDCHTAVHDISNQLRKNANPLTPYENKKSQERCLYLSSVIENARVAVEENPENKRFVYSGFHDADTHRKLVRLTKHLQMSQKKLIRFAIQDLYRRHFDGE